MMIKPSSVGKLSALALATTLTACGSTSSSSDGSSGLVQTKPAKQITGEPVTPSDKWKLIWSDEFEGDEIDTRKWGFEENCWGGGNNEQQCYTDRKVNAFVEDGKLNIVAKKGNFTGPDNPDGKKRLKQNPSVYFCPFTHPKQERMEIRSL
ncbi:beta-glucanase precursor [Agarivorans albus MKT 106]|uniref:Beta-glucanase n=1 Tax=Agarivorans albus MKT 106 TaxID=1331007 RepID=R9PKL6_AGAAL|nr:beta-glucanase precursor [Agarivorans albus]GAD01870.1 beta-glucanase precursor [Agarivorans albus MKT 106]